MDTQPLVLIGLPGSGKSSVSEILGRLTSRPVVGLDALIESRAGRKIGEIFADEGEARFRDWESETLNQVIAEQPDAIIDGGGGLVLRADNRALLGRAARTVWLDGPDTLLSDRVGDAADRPLLVDDPLSKLRRLRRDRLVHYTSAADVIIDTDGLDEEAVAKAVQSAAQALPKRMEHRLVERVELADGRGYPVIVGRGVVDQLPAVVPQRARRVAVVTQSGIGIDVDSGRDQRVFVVEDGEQAKRLDVVGQLASEFARWGMTRADCVVSVGGGVVSDLAGFVAASYHRGIPVVHVATTLLGQIDAAIGGKCGVNLPEGKNLVGAFWQPAAVICDVDTLDGLPAREFRSGMGELAKYHFLGGGRLDRVELVERVARSARIKADVVSGDEREGGRRAILNYGHTLAHALETAGRYDLRHGEAVGIGLIYAAELAARLGRIDRDRVAEHRRVVAGYGLETSLPQGFDHDELIDLFGRDKKAVDGVTFVLDGPRGVEPVAVEDRDLLGDALMAISTGPGGRP
ncbi:MAG: shikimate kinase [Acidimicrobiales bacterium]